MTWVTGADCAVMCNLINRGFAKKGYTSLFLRQKGARLENEKMRQQSRQKDQNVTRHKRKSLGFNDNRYTVLALPLVSWKATAVKRVYCCKKGILL